MRVEGSGWSPTFGTYTPHSSHEMHTSTFGPFPTTRRTQRWQCIGESERRGDQHRKANALHLNQQMRSRLGYSSQRKEYTGIGSATRHLALRRFLLHMSSLNLFGSGARGKILGDCEEACRRVLKNMWQYKEKILQTTEHIKNKVD